MHILLTRPQRQGERTVGLLQALGHRVTHVPLLHIEANTEADLGADGFAAVVITSANAAEALAQHPQRHDILSLPAFVVGDRTAAAAREAGFGQVTSAVGDVAELAALAGREIPAGASVLYLAGTDRAGDLAGDLAAAGRAVRTIEIYSAVAASALPDEAFRALTTDSVDAILHYSRRSAKTLLDLATAASLLVNVLKCRHFCLSAQVAEPLAVAGAERIRVAQRPDEAALLDLVGNT